MLLIFLDTETNGVNPQLHRILEIAFVVVDSITGRHLLSYETLIAQPREVFASSDSESLAFTGITFEMTLGGKSEIVTTSEIITELNRIGLADQSGVFICQNPSFDRAFFSQLVDVDIQTKYGWPYHWLDLASMYLAARLIRDRTTLQTLREQGLSKDKIAAHYGLPPESKPHRAKNGVTHLMACYEAIFGKIGPT